MGSLGAQSIDSQVGQHPVRGPEMGSRFWCTLQGVYR